MRDERHDGPVLDQPEGWIQGYAQDWWPAYDECVQNGLGAALEDYARGGAELPTERDFTDALRVIKTARAAVRAERARRRAPARPVAPCCIGCGLPLLGFDTVPFTDRYGDVYHARTCADRCERELATLEDRDHV